MDIQQILSMTDHTLLRTGCTREDIEKLCEEAVESHCAAVCIPPCFVSCARDCVGDSGVRVCTVIGFPNGYQTIRTKTEEAKEAIENGATEIDMVINLSYVKGREWDKVREEISRMRETCDGILLKVIIETCLLTDRDKIRLCEIITECGVDYIKTSTGYSLGGATVHDVALLKRHVGEGVRVKASGGIHSMSEAQAMIDAGASRIGARGIVKASHEMV